MLLLDVATTAVGLSMGGYESNVIAAGIIHYYGLAGFEMVKIPGVAVFVAVAIIVSLNWNKTSLGGRYALAAAAFLGFAVTVAPVANNLLEILGRA
jgi:preprotein translocase subunit Sec61beta